MGKEKLLLVDDEEGIRTVLGISLTDAGYDVRTAADGEEALAVFADHRPSIVLTDIKMPGIDGIELLKRIKARNPDTEVIMITGHGDLDLAIESIKHEATDFVTKPVHPDILDIALKRAREKLSMRRELRAYTENLENLVEEQAARLVKMERLSAVGQAVDGMTTAMGNITADLVTGLNLLEEMPCFVAVHDKDRKIVATNRLYLERLGDRVGQDSCDVYDSENQMGDRETVCPVERTFESGVAQRCKAWINYLNGERYPVIVHTAPIRNSRNEIELVMEVAADVSEIRRLQQALETTRKRYRQLFDEVPCYIAVLDSDFNVVATNQGYAQFFGDAIGRQCFRVCKRREDRCPECPVADTFADGMSHEMETVLTGVDGERRNVLVRTTPLRNNAGELTQVMEMATDITELRLLQDNLSMLGLMVGSISHNIKGILTGLDAGLYLMDTGREKQLPERVERGFEKVRIMTGRIRKVVLDLLYCAKDRKPQFDTVSIPDLMEDVRTVIEPKSVGKDISIDWRIDPSLSTFEAEEGTLHAALVAILENAVEACSADRYRDTHQIVCRATDDEPDAVVFTITDDGPGMPAEVREKLFDLFYSSKGSKGTGLGLFLAHRAVAQHGGCIDVESEPRQGATFTIRIPRRRDLQSSPRPGKSQ